MPPKIQAVTAATRIERRLTCAKFIAASLFHPAHFAHQLPLHLGHRLHRWPPVFDKCNILEPRFGLDGRERYRLGQWLVGHSRDRYPRLVFRCRWIRERLADYVADPDDLFLVACVIEKELVALLHVLEMPSRREIAYAGPGLTLCATLDLVVPGIFLRLRLQQPICHGFIPI